jgi:hypothetical protein
MSETPPDQSSDRRDDAQDATNGKRQPDPDAPGNYLDSPDEPPEPNEPA